MVDACRSRECVSEAVSAALYQGLQYSSPVLEYRSPWLYMWQDDVLEDDY